MTVSRTQDGGRLGATSARESSVTQALFDHFAGTATHADCLAAVRAANCDHMIAIRALRAAGAVDGDQAIYHNGLFGSRADGHDDVNRSDDAFRTSLRRKLDAERTEAARAASATPRGAR